MEAGVFSQALDLANSLICSATNAGFSRAGACCKASGYNALRLMHVINQVAWGHLSGGVEGIKHAHHLRVWYQCHSDAVGQILLILVSVLYWQYVVLLSPEHQCGLWDLTDQLRPHLPSQV